MAKPSILFLHQNFPAQFRSLAGFMHRQGWDVIGAGDRPDLDEKKFKTTDEGFRVIGYRKKRDPNPKIHRYLKITEKAILNGQGFAATGLRLKRSGIKPDVVVAHSGWGSGSFACLLYTSPSPRDA